MKFVDYCPGRLGRECVSGKDGGPAQLKPRQQYCGTCMRRKSIPGSDGLLRIVLIVIAGVVVIIYLAGGFRGCSVFPPGSEETDNGASGQRGVLTLVAENGRLAS